MPFIADTNNEMQGLLDGALDETAATTQESSEAATSSARVPWLILADWLDDHNDPRAEFLRIDPSSVAEKEAWLTQHEREWFGDLSSRVRITCQAGFPGLSVTLTPQAKVLPKLAEAINAGWLLLERCNPTLHLPQMPNLRRLTLVQTIEDADLAAIAATNIESLDMRGVLRLTDSGYTSLMNCGKLVRLAINNGRALTDGTLAQIANAVPLHTLEMRQCREIRGASLGELQQIRSLLFEGIRLGVSQIRKARPLPHLERLRITSPHTTGTAIAALPALANLHTLELQWINNLQGRYLGCLKRMPKLQRLHLVGVDLNETALTQLPSPQQLRELQLWSRYSPPD
jgi:hypothetical protein